MSKRKRPYVGHRNGKSEAFLSAETPTEASHGATYTLVTGPFRTRRAADFMASPGGHNNPHCVTVRDAERIANT